MSVRGTVNTSRCDRSAQVQPERQNVSMDWRNHIHSTPDVLRGKPRLAGTRIPVSLVLGYLAAGKAGEEVVEEFPDLSREQVAACLAYARELAEFEVVA